MYCVIIRNCHETRAIKCDTLLDIQETIEILNPDIDCESLVYDGSEVYFDGVSYQVTKLENCDAIAWS